MFGTSEDPETFDWVPWAVTYHGPGLGWLSNDEDPAAWGVPGY